MVRSRRAGGSSRRASGWRGVGTTGTHLDGHLVGGATDAAAAHLELGLDVVDRTLERGDRLGARLLLDDLQRVVHDLLGGRALAALHDLVDHLGDEHRAVDRDRA
jgi:hypothetical protein